MGLLSDRKKAAGRSFFRGNELRGLIVFVVVLAIGWPVILNYARPKDRVPEPPPPVDSRPLNAETGIEFAGLIDKSPMSFRDNAAYKILLDRARTTSSAELSKAARRDVMYTNLWERPDLYRGVPIHFEGTLRKTLAHEKMNPELSVKGKLIECWFVTRESNPLPLVVMIEEPPPGLVISPDMSERVVVDAYFLKLLRYIAGDAHRAAPLLVGRLRWMNADVKTGALPNANPAPPSWANPVLIVGGLLVVYLGFRIYLTVMRYRKPGPRSYFPSSVPEHLTEDLPATDLNAMLAAAADEETGLPSQRTQRPEPPPQDLDLSEIPPEELLDAD
jgi:xanthosine utilization system XapX-like protein